MRVVEEFDDELYHHGIKGQKWGVRRYQNEDGTRTSAGKARRRESFGEFVNKNVKKAKQKFSKARAERKAARFEKKEHKRLSDPTKMTDAELKAAVSRLQMEKNYNDLMGSARGVKAKKTGSSMVAKVLNRSAENFLNAASDALLNRVKANWQGKIDKKANAYKETQAEEERERMEKIEADIKSGKLELGKINMSDLTAFNKRLTTKSQAEKYLFGEAKDKAKKKNDGEDNGSSAPKGESIEDRKPKKDKADNESKSSSNKPKQYKIIKKALKPGTNDFAPKRNLEGRKSSAEDTNIFLDRDFAPPGRGYVFDEPYYDFSGNKIRNYVFDEPLQTTRKRKRKRRS